MKQKKNKKQRWLRFRHRLLGYIGRPILRVIIRLRYGLRVRSFRDGNRRNYLVLMNHQTAFDQFFAALAFKRYSYFVASEDLFSMGWLSRALSYLVAPIPIRKSMTDVRAVMTCKRVAREGGTIVIAPEGNRTYDGTLCYMKPSIAGLVRALRLPVALFRLEGGYGVHPRWSDVVRRGGMTAGVVRVIETEEYDALTDDELFALITEGLTSDEYATGRLFHHKKRAEYLERALYYCPQCGITHLVSHGATVTCPTCGMTVEYQPDLTLRGVGCDFPYRTVAEWYAAQSAYIGALDLAPYADTPLASDVVSLCEVIPYDRKNLLSPEVMLSVYADRYEIVGSDLALTVPFRELQATCVLGRNKLNLYRGEGILQIKGSRRFNAVKYMNVFYRAKYQKEGVTDAKLLGI